LPEVADIVVVPEDVEVARRMLTENEVWRLSKGKN
jgi:hypothetical protein